MKGISYDRISDFLFFPSCVISVGLPLNPFFHICGNVKGPLMGALDGWVGLGVGQMGL